MLSHICLHLYILWILLPTNQSIVRRKDPIPIGKRFEAEGIVPHVIPVPPNETLMMSYRYDVKTFPGIALTYVEIKEKPKGRWTAISDAEYYTLVMCSPDVPRGELQHIPYAEWYPWIVRNIPGLKLAKGEQLSPYYLPNQARRPDELFYVVFLVYKQQDFIDQPDLYLKKYPDSLCDGKFRVRIYAEMNNLTEPKAGTYILLSYR